MNGELHWSLLPIVSTRRGTLLCRQDYSRTFQEVPYGWNWFVWSHSYVKITETIDAPARGQALSQVDRCYSSVSGGVEVALHAWSGESIGQVGQIDQSVTGEGLVEHGDALIEQHRRLIGLIQLKQAVTRAGRYLRWRHPVQPARVAIVFELLDLRARFNDSRRASRSIPQGGEGVRLADIQLSQQPRRLAAAYPRHRRFD
jgi:hypothetical protein